MLVLVTISLRVAGIAGAYLRRIAHADSLTTQFPENVYEAVRLLRISALLEFP